MTVRDRILAACAGNEEQAELVLSQLARVRLLREEGRHPSDPTPVGDPPALLPEQLCPNCHIAYDDGCCLMCGRLEVSDTTAGARS